MLATTACQDNHCFSINLSVSACVSVKMNECPVVFLGCRKSSLQVYVILFEELQKMDMDMENKTLYNDLTRTERAERDKELMSNI